MGNITSDFTLLPADADPNRVALYANIYADLTALGLGVPVTASNVITRANLLAFLQRVVGQLIKDELSNDPAILDYTGGDASLRNQVCANLEPNLNNTTYMLAAVSTTTVITLTGANFHLIPILVGASVKFKRNTPSVALQSVTAEVLSVLPDSITLVTALPVSAAIGDRFKFIDKRIKRRARLNELTVGIPHCPNDLTTADITAAKV
jgi:hypothetical protein